VWEYNINIRRTLQYVYKSNNNNYYNVGIYNIIRFDHNAPRPKVPTRITTSVINNILFRSD